MARQRSMRRGITRTVPAKRAGSAASANRSRSGIAGQHMTPAATAGGSAVHRPVRGK